MRTMFIFHILLRQGLQSGSRRHSDFILVQQHVGDALGNDIYVLAAVADHFAAFNVHLPVDTKWMRV